MKRILLTIIVALAALAFVGAQVTPAPLVVKDARNAAMGGAFTALSSGYQSLYGNPAGFGAGRGMLTLANASVWGFVVPTTANIEALTGLDFADMGAVLGTVDGIITGNGLGAGAAAGIGFTGGGLGIGATVISEEYAKGNTLLGTRLTSVSQANFIVGMAITLGPKNLNIRVGGDLRPFVRIEGDFGLFDLIGASMGDGGDPSTLIMASPANYGVGLAVDLGASMTIGSLSAGLAIRDIAPPFAFTDTTFGELGAVQASEADPMGQFLPDISLAASWAPRLIPGLLDPAVYLELRDPINVLKSGAGLWNMLHVGGELKVLSLVYLRAGLNQGWTSVGAGINLLILQLDVAAFTEELGSYPGDSPRSGVAANVRLHL